MNDIPYLLDFDTRFYSNLDGKKWKICVTKCDA